MNTKQNPPAADRLAQTVTDEYVDRIEKYARTATMGDVDEAGFGVVNFGTLLLMPRDTVLAMCDAIRARESAQAQEAMRKFELVGFCYGGKVVDDKYQPVELAEGTNLYITRWTAEEIAASANRARELFGQAHFIDDADAPRDGE